MLSSAMRTCFMSWSHAPMRYALIYSSHLVILVHACHEVFKCVFLVSALATSCNHPTTTKSTKDDQCRLSKSQGDVLGIVQCHHSDLGEVLTLRTWNCWNRNTDPTRKSQSEIPKNQLRFRAHEAGEQSSIQNIPKRREFIRVS